MQYIDNLIIILIIITTRALTFKKLLNTFNLNPFILVIVHVCTQYQCMILCVLFKSFY